MTNQYETRTETATSILYDYACDLLSAATVKSLLADLGFMVDLRRWTLNMIDLEDIETGHLVTVEV